MKQKLLIFGAQMAIGPWLRDVGEGVYGARAKAAYWWLRGKKTLIGFLVALLGGALTAFAPGVLAAAGPALAVLGGLAMYVGLLDKAVNSKVVIPDWFTEGFHALLGYSGWLATGVGLVAHVAPPLWADRLDLVCAAVGQACFFVSSFMTDKPYKYALPPFVGR